jgi:hypothetical protein
VLIWKDKTENGGYIAQVTDFGYSTVYSGHGRIDMPKTPRWHAPEWAKRGGFSFTEAQKMDSYSFGLVCLWLLLYNSLDPLDLHTMRERSSDTTAVFARKSVESKMGSNTLQREKLTMLFALTLASEPETRSSDFDKILSCLAMRR